MRINTVSNYMIKVVYPGWYALTHNPKAGFPKNRKKVAEQVVEGQNMFIYVTSPEKKIVGMTRVKSGIKLVDDSRWPYVVDLEWVIPPKPGVTFKDVGLDIRPRVGDTLFSIAEDQASDIIEALMKQRDLDERTLEYLTTKYSDGENR